MDSNEARLHEATLILHTHAIALVNGKQHLSAVVFSALVGFSLLEKYATFGVGEEKQAYLESQKSQGATYFSSERNESHRCEEILMEIKKSQDKLNE